MEKYTLNLDENKYILSISHTSNDNIELDLSEYDLSHLSAYKLVDGKLVLDETKLQELKLQEILVKNKEEISVLKSELATYDYIGTKIATGVATKEEYAKQIAYMETLRIKIRELEGNNVWAHK